MAESIESLRRQRVEVVEIPPDAISPDPTNPNTIDDGLMDALRADIVERGFVQPVVVRHHPEGGDRWIIVDGEHRWRVLTEAGADSIPCVVDPSGEDDGRLRMLTLNRLRGEFVPVKMAGVLARLAAQMDEAELTRRLGMDADEWTAVMAADGMGDVGERLADALQRESDEAPEVFSWKFRPEAAALVEQAITELMVAGARTRADAVIQLLDPGHDPDKQE